MDYKKEYFKYKEKYLKLKNRLNQKGGDYNSVFIDELIQMAYQIHTINEINKDIFNFNNLNIKNNRDIIIDRFFKHNYIELRPHNNERTLLFACGNRRIDNANLDVCRLEDNCDQIKMNKYHSHEGAYTIDMTLAANPSIVADVKPGFNLPDIPDNSFDLIFFEGGAEPKDIPELIKRLLNKNNNTSLCIDINEGDYKVYAYCRDGKYVCQTQPEYSDK